MISKHADLSSVSGVSRLVKSDLLVGHTPVSLFQRLYGDTNICWIDNAVESKSEDRWSYLLIHPSRYFKSNINIPLTGMACNSSEKLHRFRTSEIAQDLLRGPLSGDTSEGPPFRCGWFGLIGYGSTQKRADRRIQFSEIALAYYDFVFAYHHNSKTWWATTCARSATSCRTQRMNADAEITARLKQIAADSKCVEENKSSEHRIAKSNCSRESYLAMVRHALDYISAGDIYQVNLAQKFSVPWNASAAELYLKLRSESPAQYGAFIGSGLTGNGRSICSVSPELFVSVRDGEIVTRPIKGTRPRGVDEASDTRARNDLESSEKERAELNMIVDLERNDLGRVCQYGSVKVLSDGEVNTLPTVHHRIATVRGKLRRGVGPLSLLRALFPGGSVTGAPKLRAMEIIDELEPEPRGPYCGAIGWLGLNGDMEFNIAIRTAIHDANSGMAHYYAGSGIVADSDPEKEYEETLHKAAAFFRATGSTLKQD